MHGTITPRSTPWPIIAGVAGAILAGCDYGEVSIYDPPSPEAVTLALTIEAGDPGAADLLGWEAGRIPQASVRVTALDPDRPATFEIETSADGRIEVPDVRPGPYRIEVLRTLSDAERAAAAASGVVAFVLDATVQVGAPSGAPLLTVPAARAGSLLISEMRFHGAYTHSGSCCHSFGTYLELYNNADTTIYLDGKLIGEGYGVLHDYSTRPCPSEEFLRADPQGIWTWMFESFPGSGTDYPLAPGTTAVVALDAIDHSVFAPDAPDLSGADFESRGPADVDNPAVPDMINHSLLQVPHGRGNQLRGPVTFVADAVDDVGTLPLSQTPGGTPYRRIPADRILDVTVDTHPTAEVQGVTFPLCAPLVHPGFSQGYTTPLNPTDHPGLALHRRPLMTLDDGRVILQWTRWSNADLFVAPMSPGEVAQAGPG